MKTTTHNLPSPQQKAALLLITLLSCLAVGGLLLYGPIPQDPSYHIFADNRSLLNMTNFWNTVSNLPFILVGMIGLYMCNDKAAGQIQTDSNIHHMFFFGGVLLTGLGSSYYHLQPDNWGLFWDRIAMAVSFMAFLAIIIDGYISRVIANKLFIPLILFGIFSTVYWIITEQTGLGDLRPYALTQFLPMLIIPIIIFAWKSDSFTTSDVLIIGTGYGFAKFFEFFDAQIYQEIHLSGHSLKHLTAALSAFWVLNILYRCKHDSEPHLNLLHEAR